MVAYHPIKHFISKRRPGRTGVVPQAATTPFYVALKDHSTQSHCDGFETAYPQRCTVLFNAADNRQRHGRQLFDHARGQFR